MEADKERQTKESIRKTKEQNHSMILDPQRSRRRVGDAKPEGEIIQYANLEQETEQCFRAAATNRVKEKRTSPHPIGRTLMIPMFGQR